MPGGLIELLFACFVGPEVGDTVGELSDAELTRAYAALVKRMMELRQESGNDTAVEK